MASTPGVFLLAVGLFALILIVGLNSLSVASASPGANSAPVVALVVVGLLGLGLLLTRRRC